MDFDPWVQRGGYLATLLYTTAIIFLILVHTRQKFLLRVTEKLFSRFPKFTQFMQKTITGFSGGLHSLRDVKRLVLAFIYSILAWALSIYYIVLIFDSLHVTFENPLLVAAFVQLVVSLGTILPAAPGQIGTFHYFCVISLTWFNLPREEAFSLAILYHALSLLLLVIPGLVAIFLEGTINFKDLLDPNLPTPETKICEVLEK
jgi:hypothetical protein